MIEVTDINEPDTLVYEWYINEDGSECHLIENFKDSEAFMAHLENVSHMFDTLFQFSTMTRAKIYGRPSDELKQSLDPLGVEYFDNFNGVKINGIVHSLSHIWYTSIDHSSIERQYSTYEYTRRNDRK